MAVSIAYLVLSAALMLVAMAALATVMVRTLLPSALLLGLTSIFIAIVLFICGYQLAAVMELLVCTGLVTAILASAISMLNPATAEESGDASLTDAEAQAEAHDQAAKQRSLRYLLLPVLVIALGALIIWLYPRGEALVPGLVTSSFSTTAETLWTERSSDIVGLSLLILAGVLGVTILIKQRGEK